MADLWHDPAPIRTLLLTGARTWGLDHPMETAQVFGRWKELVGEQVAARCEPASLGRGVLKVWAASAPWASELRYLAPEVIRRVNAGVGREVVKELKVALRPATGRGSGGRGVGPPSGPGSRVGACEGGAGAGRKLRVPGRRYLWEGGSESTEAQERAAPNGLTGGDQPDAADVARAEALVAGIGDERLAAATKRALLAAKTQRAHAGGRGR